MNSILSQPMDEFLMVLPSSSRVSASPFTLNVASNLQTRFHSHNKVNEMKAAADTSEVEAADKKVIKKQRFAFQTRSQVDILDDGYRWRKYGQKTVKNSNFPRSYYKCTAKGCNVKKQIQRSSKNEEMVVTTYEGMHTHQTDKFRDSFEQIFSQMHTNT